MNNSCLYKTGPIKITSLLGCSLLLLCFLIQTTSCGSNRVVKNTNWKTIELIKARSGALSEAVSSYREVLEYRVLRSNHKSLLNKLYREGEDRGCEFINWKAFDIIENYEGEGNRYSGVIWQDEIYFLFDFDINKKIITSLVKLSGLEDYPNNPDIHISVIEFYQRYIPGESLFGLPANGRTNNGYYLYTKIYDRVDQFEVYSHANRQW
ncbi:hypothetical protein [Lewinella cohaerens]|uniref:hypothetical protein n=1 Tax=Lewinella cohaerens TaxID=70995 RepID=UPI0003A58ED4|nr:hypothetical protein [Lewinella cohaerens]